ncbi:carbohydrate-binding module family 20 domain-containing protein [Glycomyces albus]
MPRALADSGYTHVQTSPPQEHILGSDTNPGEEDAWYIHYQPVSYKLDSRLGTRAEFANMVSVCADNGIGVLADAVINHMAAGASETRTGWAGSQYSRFDYPDAGYSEADFHNTGSDYCEIGDYTNRTEVQECHLVGLNDLDTGSSYVQGRIAGYLNDLMSLGVAGFRIDAAKHIDAGELGAILSQVNGDPYIVQEVIEGGGEPITADEYTGNGDVHNFPYAIELKNHINGGAESQYLTGIGTDWDYIAEAGTFVANHDTERNGQTMNQTYGRDYLLGEAFMLAHSYGTPSSYTGYSYSSSHEGPPLNADGSVADVNCGSDAFTCVHRSPYMSGMAGFRAAVRDAALTNVWQSGDALAFGRGGAGHFVMNASGGSITRTFATDLADGDYVDVISGGTVTVSDGTFTATVAAKTALAIYTGNTGGGGGGEDSDCVEVSAYVEDTVVGDEVYMVGSIDELGDWTAIESAHLSGQSYPEWTGTISIPAGTSFEYKYVIVDSGGNYTWESGSNRTATIPDSGCLTLNETWGD